MSEGIPLHGDRGVWDVLNYEDEHSRDINDATLRRHTPLPGAVGGLMQSDGVDWQRVNSISMALADLDDYARGSIIRGGAAAWEAHAAETNHFILVGDGVDITSKAFDWDDMAAGAGADMVHDHSAAGEGGTLDWDTVWADAVHDHSAAGEGGQLDWDTAWADAVHDHSVAGEGGEIPLASLGGYTQGDLIYGGGADWQDLAHPGAANRVLQSTAAEVGWSASAITFPAAGAAVVGTGGANQVAYWTGANTITGDAGMTYNAGTDTLTVGAIDVASGGDIDPADASGQDLGDATHRWDLYTQDVIFGGATGVNAITVPDNVADALHISDADGIEYVKIISTDAQPIIRFNDDGVDIDFEVEAIGHADAFQVQGSDGQITFGMLTAGYVKSSAAGVLSISTDIPLIDLGSYTQGDLIYGGAADWQDLAHPGAANRVLQSTAAEVGWSAQALILTTALTNQGAAGTLNWSGAFTLTVPATGTAALGTGVINHVAYWNAVNVLTNEAQLALLRGGTAADLSGTGGANQYVKQVGVGAAFTVGIIGAGDLPGIGGVPVLTLGLVNAAGAAATYIQTDASIAIFDAVVPNTIQPDDAAATGVAAFAARRDHEHAIVCAAPVVNLSVSSINAEGAAYDFSRSDHDHAITTSSAPGAAASILATDAGGNLTLAGTLTLSALGLGYVKSSVAGVLSVAAVVPLIDLGSYTRGDLIYGGAADWEDLAHPGAANRVLQSTAAELGWSANAVTFPAAGATVVGTGGATQVAYWSGVNTITGDAGMTYNAGTDSLTAGNYYVPDGGEIGIITAELLTFNAGANNAIFSGCDVGIGAAPVDKFDLHDGYFSLTDSDVNQPVTDEADASAYGRLSIIEGMHGGLHIRGINDTSNIPLWLDGIIGVANPIDTHAAVWLQGSKWDSGTGKAVLGAAETVLQIGNYNTPLITVLGSGYTGYGTPTPERTIHLEDAARVDIVFEKTGSQKHYVRKDGDYLRWRGDDDVTTLFEMRNNASGNVCSFSSGGRVGFGNGMVLPLAQVHIDQSVNDALIPVLTLDQADISEGFINFIGSDRTGISGTVNAQASVRVELNGAVYRLALYIDA